jgi:hypothetical protein
MRVRVRKTMILNPHDKPRFTGKVTASVSHEIQNVLAIIKERAGLMEDLLSLGGKLPPEALAEKFRGNLEAIRTQVQRGVRLTSGLNGFAHTADHEHAGIDVTATLDRLVFITQRLIRSKEITIAVNGCDRSPSLVTDPVIFQMSVHRAVECLYRLAPFRASITVSTGESHGRVLVHLTLASGDPDTGNLAEDLTGSEDWYSLESACGAIQGTAEVDLELPGIRLTFPKDPGPAA